MICSEWRVDERAVNEVWREHAFQLAVTFHGGMVGMAYEWGSPDHPHKKDKSGNWQAREGAWHCTVVCNRCKFASLGD